MFSNTYKKTKNLAQFIFAIMIMFATNNVAFGQTAVQSEIKISAETYTPASAAQTTTLFDPYFIGNNTTQAAPGIVVPENIFKSTQYYSGVKPEEIKKMVADTTPLTPAQQEIILQNKEVLSEVRAQAQRAEAQKLENSQSQKTETNKRSGVYQPLAGIEGVTKDGEQTGLKNILNFIFTWGIRVAVLLAVIMIIFGGVEYMTSDAVFNKEDGIHKINAAIIGLILTLSAWLILYTINPRIVEEPNSPIFGPTTK